MDMERATKALQTVESVPLDDAGYAVEDLEDAVREVVNAPRMWWCTGVVFSYRPDDCPEDSNHHRACCWVRIVKEDN